ncbi:TspO/MBR family protein [Oharaeibacter diazotrophicus]|uniref:TspO/MBR related protein n=1 Tax=Oharaeibacter diazotrophicus TaxID=1920512 RepID=A0A4R6RDA6_9HYPH|nr:TspO/MBR family protein [Oharaeibacter diazotrophicus]TDP84173.1 TspO/MBR related protein [Oharaeibacter diazotrophicus]BBE73210.1 TspO/MBR family protein [Pleomorphomonas sp. SM30]GLS75001.1 TspO/MBR-related protein [Oharaeibacter diazotrophicus]
MTRSSTAVASAFRLLGAVALCFSAAAIGSAATLPAIPTWYAGLDKPAFTPPNAVFGPVWTLLYLLMALVLWRLFEAPAGPARRRALTAFLVQLVLNAAWSVAFFGLHSPAAGLAVILPLWLAIAWTIAAARPVVGRWSLALAPYLAWVSYAVALNVGVLLLND